jgi:hypothetical protein
MSLAFFRGWSLLLCAGLLACSSGTEPAAVRLDIAGTVRNSATQTSVAGARVILMDRRSSLESGYVLASATSNASGAYQLSADAKRPGYEAGCNFVLLFVEGFHKCEERRVYEPASGHRSHRYGRLAVYQGARVGFRRRLPAAHCLPARLTATTLSRSERPPNAGLPVASCGCQIVTEISQSTRLLLEPS